jgi:hypothetical protein
MIVLPPTPETPNLSPIMECPGECEGNPGKSSQPGEVGVNAAIF